MLTSVRPLLGLAVIAFLCLVIGCDNSSQTGSATTGPSTGNASSSGPIKIGEYGSMTGSEATFGISTDNGVKLAVKERNAAGGVKGRQILLSAYDDQGKAQE